MLHLSAEQQWLAVRGFLRACERAQQVPSPSTPAEKADIARFYGEKFVPFCLRLGMQREMVEDLYARAYSSSAWVQKTAPSAKAVTAMLAHAGMRDWDAFVEHYAQFGAEHDRRLQGQRGLGRLVKLPADRGQFRIERERVPGRPGFTFHLTIQVGSSAEEWRVHVQGDGPQAQQFVNRLALLAQDTAPGELAGRVTELLGQMPRVTILPKVLAEPAPPRSIFPHIKGAAPHVPTSAARKPLSPKLRAQQARQELYQAALNYLKEIYADRPPMAAVSGDKPYLTIEEAIATNTGSAALVKIALTYSRILGDPMTEIGLVARYGRRPDDQLER